MSSPSDHKVLQYFQSTIARDFFDLFAGDYIGGGAARAVYECTIRPDLVVKIEAPSQSFQNALEWEFWRRTYKLKDVRRWLAPCVSISACGSVLLQERTTPIPEGKYPEKLPKFLTDIKRVNFGRLGRRTVCHDYAIVVAEFSLTMRKADWW